jgi:uncharacterized protein involved in response to NO
MLNRQTRLHRKATAMTVVVALQALAAMLFLADFAADVADEGWTSHLAVEGAAAIALLVAVVAGRCRCVRSSNRRGRMIWRLPSRGRPSAISSGAALPNGT